MVRIHTLTVRNRATAFALLAVGVGAIGLFLVVGLMLLAGLAVGGVALAAGMAISHRLRGSSGSVLRSPSPATARLDPGLEVFPNPVGRVGAGTAASVESIGPMDRKLDPSL